MLRQHRPMSSSVAAWAPTTPTDLRTWYDATAGVTNTSGKASAWNDQSGNGNHFAQATAGLRPTIVTDSTSGLQALRFATSAMGANDSSSLDLGAQGAIFMAFNFSASGGANACALTKAPSDGYHAYNIQAHPSGSPFWFDLNGLITINFANHPYTGRHTLAVVWNGSTLRSWWDGTLKNTVAAAYTATNTTEQLVIGSQKLDGTNPQDGDYFECFMYGTAPSDTDIANANTYLHNRWSTT